MREVAQACAVVVALLGSGLSSASGPAIERKHPRFDSLVPPDARLEEVAGGFEWVEGPLWSKSEGRLYLADIPRNRVVFWSEATGVRPFLERSGYTGAAAFTGREPGSNGMTFDRDGRLVICQHGDRRIVRLEKDGTRTVLADRFEGKRLNSPNDAVFRANGDLYFTDPPFGLPRTFDDPQKDLSFQGVYRVTPNGRVTLLTKELRAPNGIVFAPSEKTLYVANADAARPVYMAYDVRGDGTLGPGRVFFDASEWAKTDKGLPDGMKVDVAGNLFAAGPGGLHVFAPDGTHLGTFRTGRLTSNCGWGGDGRDLFITADKVLYRVRLTTRGF